MYAVDMIRKIGIDEVLAKAIATPIGNDAATEVIARTKVRKSPPMKKLPGTSTVDSVVVRVTR
jgi:hypothetical protein